MSTNTPSYVSALAPRLSALKSLCLIAVGALSSSCLNYDHVATMSDEVDTTPPPLFEGASVGGGCSRDLDCRRGLLCDQAVCVASGEGELNDPCVRSDECLEGLRCGWAGFCVTEGEREVGEACAHDGECARGVSCERTGGIAGQCVPRDGGADGLALGEPCEGSDLCAEGLTCSPERGACIPSSLLLNPDTFRGVACDLEAELAMPFGVRAAMPSDEADFFATPFPNDLRVQGGKLDLSAYPRPGAAFGDRDLFGGLLEAISNLREGWSRNPAIYFRLTRPLKEDQADPERLSVAKRYLRLVNLTTGEDHPFEAAPLKGRNKYICHNALYMHPLWSHPLEAGHTYAAIVMSTIRDEAGEPPQPLDATQLLLSTTTPTDSSLRSDWLRYGPLRQWLREQGSAFSADDIAGATVFTVRQESPVYERGREAVYRADVPRFVGAPLLCQAGVRSPCATPEYTPPPQLPDLRDPRDCPAEPSPMFHEVHARVRLPIFQRGELPYTRLGDGDIELEGDTPKVKSYQDICMAITVPKEATMPTEGWPVMIYGHGTGGRFRAGAQLLGASLSSLSVEETPAPMVIIGIDQSMHGDRKGDDPSLSPGPLFFNVQNPVAARGNLIQGALDNFALVRFIKESPDLQGLIVEGLGDFKLNPQLISYHGHSQGGTTGPLFAPFEDELSGAVFSGTAGGLLFSLLGKKEPYDATVGLRLTLQELELDEFHPAMHIFQELFDDVDPVNFASRLYSKPHGRPIHGLHIIGRHDMFTPDSGQRSFAAASGGTLAKPSAPFEGFDTIEELGVANAPYPIKDNVRDEDRLSITGAISQFEPERGDDGAVVYDGHFVAYRNRAANRQLLRFLGDLALGNSPSVISGEVEGDTEEPLPDTEAP